MASRPHEPDQPRAAATTSVTVPGQAVRHVIFPNKPWDQRLVDSLLVGGFVDVVVTFGVLFARFVEFETALLAGAGAGVAAAVLRWLAQGRRQRLTSTPDTVLVAGKRLERGVGHVEVEFVSAKGGGSWYVSHSKAGTLAIHDNEFSARARAEMVCRHGAFPFHWGSGAGVEVRQPDALDMPAVERWRRHPELVLPAAPISDPLITRAPDGAILVQAPSPASAAFCWGVSAAAAALMLVGVQSLGVPQTRHSGGGGILFWIGLVMVAPLAVLCWMGHLRVVHYRLTALAIERFQDGRLQWSFPVEEIESFLSGMRHVDLMSDSRRYQVSVHSLGKGTNLGLVVQQAMLGTARLEQDQLVEQPGPVAGGKGSLSTAE